MALPKHGWSKEDTISMIQMYESFPELWNSCSPDYKDRNKKSASIKTIAETFNTTVEEISRKIHNIRCQLNAEVRKIKKKYGNVAVEDYESSWEYFSCMKFLVNCRAVDNIEISQVESDDSQNPLSIQVKCEYTQPMSKRRKKLDPLAEEDNLETIVPVNTRIEDNEIFGKYVTTELNNLNTYYTNKLKLLIKRAILEVTEEVFKNDHKNMTFKVENDDFN